MFHFRPAVTAARGLLRFGSRFVWLLSLVGLATPAPSRSESSSTVTFNGDVAPILFDNCSPCHRPGEAGPFSLLSYRDAKKRAGQIAHVVESRFMPPWLPEPGHRRFQGERRLSDRQIETILQWVRAGAPEGSSPSPSPPEFAEGWQLGEPDLIVEMSETYVLQADGADVFRNFVIPIPVQETRYVRAVEMRPGNPRVVHHALFQIDRGGSCRRLDEADPGPGFGGMELGDSEMPQGHLLSWSPGRSPDPGTDEMAWRLEPDSDLTLQLHLLPSGRPERIQARIGLHFADAPPRIHPYALTLRCDDIDIPPGDDNYTIEDEFVLPVDAKLLSLYPHAHYLGKKISVDVRFPDGRKTPALRIGNWDFNWQDQYRLTEPWPLPKGTVIRMRYTYDNSANNVRNPNHPPKRVVHGGRSSDEMGTLVVQLIPENEADLALLEEAGLRYAAANPSNPKAGLAHSNLGVRLEARGLLEESIRHYREAVRLRPGDHRARNNLALALRKKGELRESIEHLREALKIAPDNAELLNNLGAALASAGQIDEAVKLLRRAVEIDNDYAEAHINLGNALGSRLEEAIRHYREALRVKPDSPEAHNSLGVALATGGNLTEAISHFKRALEVRPDYADARKNLQIVTQAAQKP